MSDTYRLGDERDRLDDRLDELADRAVQADDETAVQMVQSIAGEVEVRLQGVEHLIETHGANATVEVQGLTAGQTARIEDSLADLQTQTDYGGGLPGSRRNHEAAAALVDAPFLDDPTEFDDYLAAVSDQPTHVAKWLRARAQDLSGIDEGNSKSFDERLAARSSTD